MPYRKRNIRSRRPRRATAGRSYRKRSMRSKRRAPSAMTGKILTGFPDRVFVKLPYEYSANQTSVGALFDQRWNLNDVFDPDRTGGGHQPRGYDQWAATYNRYRVHKVTGYVITRQRAAHGISVNLIASNDANAITDVYSAEQAHSTKQLVTSSNVPPTKHLFRWFPNKITGVSKQTYNSDDRYQAQVGSSPAETIVMHHLVEAVDSTTALDYEYTIRLTYWVEFFDRVYIGPS